MKTRCFVDANGHIWSINHNDESNYPGDIELLDDTVRVLGAKDCLGSGREICEEYQLWPSLTSLAMVLEQSIEPNADGSVSLEQAVAQGHLNIQSFDSEWRNNNAMHPDRYPMSLAEDNAGLWFEQISDHANSTLAG